jgi:hypothetical protein
MAAEGFTLPSCRLIICQKGWGVLFEDTYKGDWQLIVKVHMYTKAFLLKAEEIDPGHQFFFPPLIQQRDALDHVMRAAYAQVFPEEYAAEAAHDVDRDPDAQKYTEAQLGKAIGHAYRAMFDAGDWLGIIFRERIRELMAGYSVETVNAVLPVFRSKIEPRVEEIGLETAGLRANKDIGRKPNMIKGADEYQALIDELEGYWKTVCNARAALDKSEYGQPSTATE